MEVNARGNRPIVVGDRARLALQRRCRRGVDRGSTPAMVTAVAAGGLAVGCTARVLPRSQSRPPPSSHDPRPCAVAAPSRRAPRHDAYPARRVACGRGRPAHCQHAPAGRGAARRSRARAEGRKPAVPPRRRPEGTVSVNAEEGVVFPRGVMQRDEDIERMGEEARRIAGVPAVENLVHRPGTPAPASRSKLERQRATE
jgi:hypothetical protein